jgi:hypothetical protein
MKGGIRTRNDAGQRRTTRAIGSVNEDIRLNKGLWRLAEEMEKIKTS